MPSLLIIHTLSDFRMIRPVIFLLMAVSVFTQCKQNSRTAPTEISSDSLQIQLSALNDSLRVSWNEMTASDDEKIRAAASLLKAISQSCNYDKALYGNIWRRQQNLPSQRYSGPDSLTSDGIDRYDASTDSLLNSLRAFYEQTGAQGCCSGCDSVLNQVEQRHGSVVMYRIRYDGHGRQYNALILQQKENLARLKPEYGRLKPKQLFSLMQ